jgi:hypothetical protein
METQTIKSPYKNINALDKICKPLILTWLADLFKYKDYPHSHTDQWITWTLWDGQLSVGFDFRQEEHVKLFSMIHPRFKGIPQYTTLKIVNEKSFYLDLKQLLHLKYPNIVSSKLINKVKHKDNDGDTFYTYDWEVFLDDDTSIMYHNQKEKMDMVKGDYIYNSIIQEKAFVNFLKEKYESQSLSKSL